MYNPNEHKEELRGQISKLVEQIESGERLLRIAQNISTEWMWEQHLKACKERGTLPDILEIEDDELA